MKCYMTRVRQYMTYVFVKIALRLRSLEALAELRSRLKIATYLTSKNNSIIYNVPVIVIWFSTNKWSAPISITGIYSFFTSSTEKTSM